MKKMFTPGLQVLEITRKIPEELNKSQKMANFGGSVWESNPPCHLLGGNTGFEVREGHQSPIHSLIASLPLMLEASQA